MGRNHSEMRSGDVADGIIIVNRIDARRELQGKFGKDMRSRPVLVCLCLVFQTGELPFESAVQISRLVHLTTDRRTPQTYFGPAL